MKVLVTCPPMLRRIDTFRPLFDARGVEITTPPVVQTLTVDELLQLVPRHDGWIIGDDPATREVFAAGRAGRLRAAVKWGIGIDNVDMQACRELEIPITNTPNMFGGEVADVAMGYIIALARETFLIDRGVRAGKWLKPTGISLAGRTVAIIGYGDIGRSLARRLRAADMQVIAYDPAAATDSKPDGVSRATWPNRLSEADFIVVTCSLTASSQHMVNANTLALARPGVRIVNVARGPVIDEAALEAALETGRVHSAALDVFETEPLPLTSSLHRHERCIFGSHNASNTADAVDRTSQLAIARLLAFLEGA